ncbi:hypothetical protein GF340_00500 [Candidatus Peregrinibacteria bacterium]|nr:hypothetical protein [Candidatus Peregrinibacteria bacterium]
MLFDPKQSKSSCLTDSTINVVEFVVHAETKNPYIFFITDSPSSLYSLNLTNGDSKIISSAVEFSNHKIMLGPNKNSLLVWRANKADNKIIWWEYDISTNIWSIWEQGNDLDDLHFSPDGKSMLALDLMNDIGYIFTSANQETVPIGFYKHCYGFNINGDTFLCLKETDSKNTLTIYLANGSSFNISKNDETIKDVIWSKEKNIIYMITKNKIDNKNAIVSFNISTEIESAIYETHDNVQSISISDNLLFFEIKKLNEPNQNAYRINGINLTDNSLLNLSLKGTSPTPFVDSPST